VTPASPVLVAAMQLAKKIKPEFYDPSDFLIAEKGHSGLYCPES
jgi:hypothetical protein